MSAPRRRRPWLTLVVLVVTAAVSTVGLLDGAVLHHLERRAGELGDAEPWRLVTSLLVHDSWLALVGNLVLLGFVGIAVERRHTRPEWLACYVGAGVVGELVGLVWQPHGAGSSVAALGLAGVLTLDAVLERDAALVPLGYATVVLVTLVGDEVGGVAGVVVVALAFLAAGMAFSATRRATRVPPRAARTLGTVALVTASALVALGDVHGPALLTGVVLALAWPLGVRDRGAARTAPAPHRGSSPGGR